MNYNSRNPAGNLNKKARTQVMSFINSNCGVPLPSQGLTSDITAFNSIDRANKIYEKRKYP
jgi:hypothetical protein